MKIPPMEAAVLYVDKQTDITKLRVAFRSFAKAPKTQKNKINWIKCSVNSLITFQPLAVKLFLVY